jgi:hypothetical protein
MRKLLSILVVITLLALLAVPVSAQRCGRFRHRHSNVTHTHYGCIGDGHKHGRSFWQKHRDKGALIGAAAGGGGAAVYTYGIRKRRRSARY